MTASEYREQTAVAWERLAGDRVAVRQGRPLTPTATAEPGLSRSGGRVWAAGPCKQLPEPASERPAGEPEPACKQFPPAADPAAVRRAALLEAAGVCEAEAEECRRKADAAAWKSVGDAWQNGEAEAWWLAEKLRRLAGDKP